MDVNDVPTNLTGLYQYIIATLSAVITSLAAANVWQWKEATNVNKARLTERDVLNKALSDANAALRDLSDTAKKRNEVMDKLGEIIAQISVALKMLTERLEFQHDTTNKDLSRAIEVVDSMAASLRGLTEKVVELNAALKHRT